MQPQPHQWINGIFVVNLSNLVLLVSKVSLNGLFKLAWLALANYTEQRTDCIPKEMLLITP